MDFANFTAEPDAFKALFTGPVSIYRRHLRKYHIHSSTFRPLECESAIVLPAGFIHNSGTPQYYHTTYSAAIGSFANRQDCLNEYARSMRLSYSGNTIQPF